MSLLPHTFANPYAAHTRDLLMMFGNSLSLILQHSIYKNRFFICCAV